MSYSVNIKFNIASEHKESVVAIVKLIKLMDRNVKAIMIPNDVGRNAEHGIILPSLDFIDSESYLPRPCDIDYNNKSISLTTNDLVRYISELIKLNPKHKTPNEQIRMCIRAGVKTNGLSSLLDINESIFKNIISGDVYPYVEKTWHDFFGYIENERRSAEETANIQTAEKVMTEKVFNDTELSKNTHKTKNKINFDSISFVGCTTIEDFANRIPKSRGAAMWLSEKAQIAHETARKILACHKPGGSFVIDKLNATFHIGMKPCYTTRSKRRLK